ncbi:TIGR02453 family protein [Neorhodopirellula lusitana]|uniref:TIGR02453 family protein n=1 Tax=Neorhodopirellula lusitana TaxID=445327 RepID=A0ABY1QQL9_9BACT|nr:TIGR02453 family protein [Neorhodopirellula lusitana]
MNRRLKTRQRANESVTKSSPISEDLFEFLEDLNENNEREWFKANKDRYEQCVREPALDLIEQLEKPLMRSAPMLRVVAKRLGGSLMRIHRDTRFGKDKTPYKTNVGISLRHDGDGDIHGPGVYIHLACDECFVGAGSWRPAKETLAAIRQSIDADPKAWIKARDQRTFRKSFELAGESLKTSPRDYAKDHPMIEDLRRIDFIAVAPLSRKEVLADDAVKRIVELIRQAKPLMKFMCEAVELPY